MPRKLHNIVGLALGMSLSGLFGCHHTTSTASDIAPSPPVVTPSAARAQQFDTDPDTIITQSVSLMSLEEATAIHAELVKRRIQAYPDDYDMVEYLNPKISLLEDRMSKLIIMSGRAGVPMTDPQDGPDPTNGIFLPREDSIFNPQVPQLRDIPRTFP